jgi:hypothetical protein
MLRICLEVVCLGCGLDLLRSHGYCLLEVVMLTFALCSMILLMLCLLVILALGVLELY